MEENEIPPLKKLFVDYEPNILKSLKRLMSFENYEIAFDQRGAEGILHLKENPVDIIISDII